MLQLGETEKWCDWSANGSPQRWNSQNEQCRRRRFQTCLANGIISTGSRRERDGDKSVSRKEPWCQTETFFCGPISIACMKRSLLLNACLRRPLAMLGAQGDSTRLTSGRLPRPPGRRETTIGFGCTTTVRLLQLLSAGLGRLLWNSSSYQLRNADAAKQSASIEQILYEARQAHQLQAGDPSNRGRPLSRQAPLPQSPSRPANHDGR
jgi:hypothetical protein